MNRTPIAITRGKTLSIIVRSRSKTYFQGKAEAISSKNDKGPFDVLPRHIHFISIIQDGVMVRTVEGENKHIPFPHGIIKVKDDTVEVYIGTEQKK